jgi:hypothetical protein
VQLSITIDRAPLRASDTRPFCCSRHDRAGSCVAGRHGAGGVTLTSEWFFVTGCHTRSGAHA